jgi:hypothetical protein
VLSAFQISRRSPERQEAERGTIRSAPATAAQAWIWAGPALRRAPYQIRRSSVDRHAAELMRSRPVARSTQPEIGAIGGRSSVTRVSEVRQATFGPTSRTTLVLRLTQAGALVGEPSFWNQRSGYSVLPHATLAATIRGCPLVALTHA